MSSAHSWRALLRGGVLALTALALLALIAWPVRPLDKAGCPVCSPDTSAGYEDIIVLLDADPSLRWWPHVCNSCWERWLELPRGGLSRQEATTRARSLR